MTKLQTKEALEAAIEASNKFEKVKDIECPRGISNPGVFFGFMTGVTWLYKNLNSKNIDDVYEIENYTGCLTGDCPHQKAGDCLNALVAFFKENPLLEKAAVVAQFEKLKGELNGKT